MSTKRRSNGPKEKNSTEQSIKSAEKSNDSVKGPPRADKRTGSRPKVFVFMYSALDSKGKRKEGMKKRWSAGANLESTKKTTSTRRKTTTLRRSKGKTVESADVRRPQQHLSFLPVGTGIVNCEKRTTFIVKHLLLTGRTPGEFYLVEEALKTSAEADKGSAEFSLSNVKKEKSKILTEVLHKGLFTMKVEWKEKDTRNLLGEEICFYLQLPVGHSSYFLKYVDHGETAEFRFFITEPINCFLEELLVRFRIEPKTAICLSFQTLRALQELHSLGYVHRDVKPMKFAIKSDGTRFRIVFSDLQTCSALPEPPSPSNKPKFSFIGCQRYASRFAHQVMFHTKQCDVESWLYMSVDFFDLNVLPWGKFENDKRKTCDAKEKFLKEAQKALCELPAELRTIAERIGGASHPETPNYNSIFELLLTAARSLGVADPEAPIEWKEFISKTEASGIPELPETTCVGDEDVEAKDEDVEDVHKKRKTKSSPLFEKSTPSNNAESVEKPTSPAADNESPKGETVDVNPLPEQSIIDFEEEADDS